ncbi:CapA family protein [Ferviditalea candida]|uniref:CapA family protein n=1 Tax=Ferviditalea candida TaxID=3108399 RepID=A0ABU5ZFS8_9BACL|nr:CapA family protein [Paenibacillaceae bacterium T2]
MHKKTFQRRFYFRAGMLAALGLALSVTMSVCQLKTNDDAQHNRQLSAETTTPAPLPSPEASAPAPAEPPPSVTRQAKLIAVGDIMMHRREIASGYDAKSKTYHYEAFFQRVKDIFADGDWVTGNLETVLSDRDPRGYTGYPEFNSPPELADALKNAGFNIITTANNHSLDRRERGVIRTLENLRARGLMTKGTAASREEAEKPLLVQKNGITMAFLAYTYGTNGIPIPAGKDYLVPLIDEKRMIRDIAAAKQAGADLVTIPIHFGQEYQLQPNDFQRKLAVKLFEAGADIILGSHPHVVQPYEFLKATGSDGRERKGVVIYSLGNFISDQHRYAPPYKPTDTGVIFEVTVRKHLPEGHTEIAGIQTLPTFVHRYLQQGVMRYRVLPIAAELAAKNDPLLSGKDYARLAGFLKEMNVHVNSMAAEGEPVQGR